MMRRVRTTVTALMAVVAAPSAAQAEDACGSYVEKTVFPVSFDEAIAPFESLKPKGEFETTAQYEARRADALHGFRGDLIIGKKPENPQKYIRYDADQGVLNVQQWAFANSSANFWEAFYAAGYYGKINVSTLGNVGVVISSTDKSVGSYKASNAFGATAQVVKILRTKKSIFDHEAKDPLRSGIFPTADDDPYVVGRLHLSVEDAKQMKHDLKIAFVVAPKEPYLVEGGRHVGDVTINNPQDVTESFSILVADIRCGLVMDRSGKVLGAYPTR